VGSDADLVIFNPNQEETISAKTHHMRVDYSMFEGIRIKGVPRTVLSAGARSSMPENSLVRPGRANSSAAKPMPASRPVDRG